MKLEQLLKTFREADKEFKPLAKHHAAMKSEGRQFIERYDARLLNHDSIIESLDAFIARHRKGDLNQSASDLKAACIEACRAATEFGKRVQSARDALTVEVKRLSVEKADATLQKYAKHRDEARAALAPFCTNDAELTALVRNLPNLILIENESNSWRRFHDLEGRAETLLALVG
jgi:hypothetical protein